MTSDVLKEIQHLCYTHQTQWIVMSIAMLGVLGLALFPRFPWRKESILFHSDLYLLVVVLATGVAYAADYVWAWRTTNALYLAIAIGVGKAARVVAFRRRGSSPILTNPSDEVVSWMIALLAIASVWPSAESRFQYHGHVRRTGPWENPNIFGILMGVGLVLVCGRLAAIWSDRIKGGRFDQFRWIRVGVLLIAAAVLANGLVHSYSRGAWIGTLGAIVYLLWTGEHRDRYLHIVSANKVFILAMAAMALVVFWHFRPEGVLTKRLFSVANVNDFSWRNRLAASEGMLKMMTDQFWFGTGWNRAEPIYETYYCVNLVDESMAIQMNDYLRLGVTLGGPVFLCFLMYIGINFSRTDRSSSPRHSKQILAGAFVIAAGFLFDGGLFVLPTAITFFVLMEMAAGLATGVKPVTEQKPRRQSAAALQETT